MMRPSELHIQSGREIDTHYNFSECHVWLPKARGKRVPHTPSMSTSKCH
jgi:hypothetical protein